MARILVFDNYDSFTYNLVHLVEKITQQKPDVFRDDQIPLADIGAYDRIILSPGPGIPSEAGILLDVIRTYAASRSILGVCLGHQAIGEVFGGTLHNLTTVYHGVATPVTLTPAGAESGLFEGLGERFDVGRYHSWVIDPASFPAGLEVTATDDHGHIMALRHRDHDVTGVQFHPESVLTPQGEIILRNWLRD